MSEEKHLVSGRELGRILGFVTNSGYVTKLKQLGILSKCYVRVEGRRHPLIDVEVAIDEIEASQDPAKDYVRQRWNDHRAGSQIDTAVAGHDDTGPADQDVTVNDKGAEPGGVSEQTISSGKIEDTSAAGKGVGEAESKVSYADEKARTQHIERQLKELKLMEIAGELVNVNSVREVIFPFLTDIRNKLLSVPDRLAGSLAGETETNAVHAILNREMRKILDELANGSDGPERVADKITTSLRH